ncbi:ATP adenylyltransferase-domain-containing protein [Phellopilus nigrolimitatus]|nr:ATP adenylyltransferase-domain-containing protein [Phellopilus nigrolimitatus]
MTSHATIISQLSDRFIQARDAGDLLFFPSTVHHHEEAGVEFEIRLCPALQKKPNLPTPHFNDGQSVEVGKPDPFAAPYLSNLKIGELKDEVEGDEFVVLLNKYSVMPNHFLLVTKDYKSQTSPLYPSELVQVYLLLDAARKTGNNFFAFYNCGDVSGASQPHKHIQFIPVDDEGPPIERLARAVNLESDSKAFTINSLPYATHIRRLPSFSSSTPRPLLEDTLGVAFMTLLDLAISTVRHDPMHPVGQPSYNVLLTRAHMYIIPRRREEHVLSETGDALSVNALGFAGMLLVKSERELDAVKKESVVAILKDVGLASAHEEQISDAHESDK